MEFSLTYKDGSVLALELSDAEFRTAHIYGDDLISISCAGVELSFINRCVPDYPVYVRWINRFGGFECYMFNGNKSYSESVDRGDEYRLADSGGLTATASRGTLSGEVSRVLSFGAEGLSFEMWKFLKGLAFSPEVWIYDPDRSTFITGTLKSTQIDWNTGNMTGTVNFELGLIDENWMV